MSTGIFYELYYLLACLSSKEETDLLSSHHVERLEVAVNKAKRKGVGVWADQQTQDGLLASLKSLLAKLFQKK